MPQLLTDTSLMNNRPAAMNRPHTAIAYALAAYAMFALMAACAKILSSHHHVAEIAFYRNLIFTVPMFAFMLHLRRSNKNIFRAKNPPGMAFRCIVGSSGIILTYAAFSHLPMADTTVLLFAQCLIIPAMAHFWLREHVGLHRWSAIGIGMIGVILMAAPTGQLSPIGVFLALAAAVLQATMSIMLRYLKDENSTTVTFYFVLAGTCVAACFMPFVAKPFTSWTDIALIGVIGASGGTAQLFITRAFAGAPASVISPFNFTGLIWATLFDITIWHNAPGWPVYIGGAIIISASLYIFHRERVNAAKHPA
jgi:drug/metabolite transporter (DMT)-like permease